MKTAGRCWTPAKNAIARKKVSGMPKGVIVIPYDVKVGDAVYMPFYDDDDHEWFVDEDRITDVCTKGMYVASTESGEDNGCLIPWEEVGDTVFLKLWEAEEKRKELEEE